MATPKSSRLYWSVLIGIGLLMVLVLSRLVVVKLQNLSNQNNSNSVLSNLAQVIGQEDRHILVVFLNNNEIRYGGGFVGSLGYISVKSGKVDIQPIKNVYYYDRLAKPLDQNLAELAPLGSQGVYMRDAAYSLAWSENALRLSSMFTQATGQPVDTVIAITPDLIKELIAQTGPIRLDDANKEVTAQNFFEVVQQEVESGEVAKSGQDSKGTIFAEIANKLVSRIQTMRPNQLANFEKLFANVIEKKQFALFSTDQNLQQFAKDNRLDQSQKCIEVDCILLAEANGGADKSSNYMSNDVHKKVDILESGDVINTITIHRKHTAKEFMFPYIEAKGGLQNWLVKRNITRLKIGVPKGSKLISSKGGEGDIQQQDDGDLTTYSVWKTLDPGQEADIYIQYQLPNKLPLEKQVVYTESVLKQFGSHPYTLQTEVKLPQAFKLTLTNNKSILMTDDGVVIWKIDVDSNNTLQLSYEKYR